MSSRHTTTSLKPNDEPGVLDMYRSTMEKMLIGVGTVLLATAAVGGVNAWLESRDTHQAVQRIENQLNEHLRDRELHENGEAKTKRIRGLIDHEIDDHVEAYHRTDTGGR